MDRYKVIKKFAKKNNKQNVIKAIKKVDQVGPKRLYYHSNSKFKGLKNLDLSIPFHFKNKYKDILKEIFT